MPGAENRDTVFAPWYVYLSRLERLVLAVVAVAMVVLLGAGLTSPATDPGVAAGTALILGAVLTFAVRWSVSTRRTTALVSFDE